MRVLSDIVKRKHVQSRLRARESLGERATSVGRA